MLPASGTVCYADYVKSSVSIALFFLLSGFFLAVLLSALERSRKLLAVAGACLAAIVMIIVFLTPVELPSWHLGKRDSAEPVASSVTATTVTAKSGLASSTTGSVPSSSTSLGQARSSVTAIKVTTSMGGSSATY
ncbi:MAG: hypothetical protein N3B14_01900 [Thermoleophilia bacterium]|nr:hypothetical protein [Thermoleophilia bacterium]